MPADYRECPEWQALNRIWKALPAEARGGVKDDFRIITDMIKSAFEMKNAASVPVQTSPAAETKPAAEVNIEPDENYLASLSPEARKCALRLLTKEGFNVYAFMMKLASQQNPQTWDDLWDAYISERDVDEDEDALMEIAQACFESCLGRGIISVSD